MALLISPRHLVDRWRHGRGRADELASLRARFASQPARRSVNDELRRQAEALRGLRVELCAMFGGSSICGGCARGHPLPAGRWAGGHCCSTRTTKVFTPDEVAALKLGGSDPRHMRPPPGLQAGCVFRGEAGCALPATDRPNICVRYVCPELRQELRVRADWHRVRGLGRALGEGFEHLVQALGRRGASAPPHLVEPHRLELARERHWPE